MSDIALNQGDSPEEVVNQLPLNTIGNVLNGDIINQSIQHAEGIVNRTEAIENELFSLPLRILNFNWKQFCDNIGVFKLVGSHFEKEICDDQVILFETKTFENKTRIIITNPEHQIPCIEGFTRFDIHTKNTKQVNGKGFIIEAMKDNMGMISYIPFIDGKKIVGLYVKRTTSSTKQFYYVGIFKPNTGIPNISINPDIIPRPLSETLTDTDKVVISNTSTRFRNKLSSWHTLSDVLGYINNIIYETVDSSYISKLMTLNRMLSFNR